MNKQINNRDNIGQFGGFTDFGIQNSVSSILGSIKKSANSVKEGAKNASKTIKDTVNDFVDIGVIIATIISEPSKITTYITKLTKITGYNLTYKEWEMAFGYLEGHYDIQSLKIACAKVLKEREESTAEILTKDIENSIYNSTIVLSKPINTNFQDSAIREAYSLLESNYGRRFLELCKSASSALQNYSINLPVQSLSSFNVDCIKSLYREGLPITDVVYLEIVRKYILFLEERPSDIINKHQAVLSLVNQIQKLFGEQIEQLSPILKIESLKFALPIETCFLGMLWGTMCYELIRTAYGDISIDNQALILSSCNLFVILTFTLFAREGLPQIFDGGVSHAAVHATKTVYNLFHDVLKPIVDMGISFANIALERKGFDCIITKNKTWNQILCDNIYKEKGHNLTMWKALNMLHTFRIADAFLRSILSDNSLGVDCLKNELIKLSPIPLNGEEKRLLTLFWNNPYKDTISNQNTHGYGLFFNYDKEIESIYEKHAKYMGQELFEIHIAACNIFREIHKLNERIGKGDPNSFDHYLVYCIAGKLKTHYSRCCIIDLTQPQLAQQIFDQITKSC